MHLGSILFYLMIFAFVAMLSGLRRSTPPSNWPRRGWPQEPGRPPERPAQRPPEWMAPAPRRVQDDFEGEFDSGAPRGGFDSGLPADEGMQGATDLEGLQGEQDLEGRQGADDPEGRSLMDTGPALAPAAEAEATGPAVARVAEDWALSQEDLARGVVLAEVLGPCRARRSRRRLN